MKNNEALIMLSDAIDLQKETLMILKEALAVLKEAVEELKASRVPTYAPITITPSPYTSPTFISTPQPYTPQPYTITCDGTNTISNDYTRQVKNAGMFYSNTEDVCGRNF
jgi:hypothetical protein